ncbi:MAG: DUF4249 family protein [Bacteroidia bacterium]
MNKHLIFLLPFLAFFTSCEKEIKIDLNSTDPKFVIVGELNNDTSVQTVTVQKTVNFDEASIYPNVKAATVVLADDAGNSETLSEVADGIYQTQNFTGVVGRTYTLTVTSENQTFTAKSTLPAPVPFAGIRFIEQVGGFGPPPQGGQGGDTSYIALPLFLDPADAQNNYRFIQTVNGEEDKSLIVRNDNIINGVPNQQPLFSFGVQIKKGDLLRVDMLNIDKNIYQYLYELNASVGTGPGGGTTPANPTSNWSNGAMGYFSAQSRQSVTAVVQ